MAREWSKKIARSNVGSDPFEKAVGESLQVIFKSNAGSAPKLYLEMPTTRWILEGDAGKKTVKVRGNDRSPMKMDAFTVFGNSHILRDRWNHKTSAVVNFEFTTTQPNHLVDYMVGKINYLSGIVDAHSRARTFRGLAYAVSGAATYRETIRNIRANNNHPRGRHEDIDHSLLDSINPRSSIKTMLIFITNNEEKVGTAGTLSAKLGGPAVWGAAPPVTPVRSGGSDVKGAFDVVTPSGETIRIGQININQLLDIVTTIEALEGSEARFRKNITDRFFWDITRFSFGEDGALTMSDTR